MALYPENPAETEKMLDFLRGPRPLKLRNKPSTGQWFLWEQQLLTGIRIPEEADPWA